MMKSPMTIVSESLDDLFDISGHWVSRSTGKKYYDKTLSRGVASLLDVKEYWNNRMEREMRKNVLNSTSDIYRLHLDPDTIERYSTMRFEHFPNGKKAKKEGLPDVRTA